MRDKTKKESSKKEKIFLTQSYFKYPLPEEMLKELSEELKDINRYPSGGEYAKLRQVLAEYMGVKIENVLPTNGSDEVIEIISRAYKGEVLIPIPTFSQYEASADRGGLSKILVNCLYDGVYSINYSVQQLKEASLVWICNPNNPTGTRIPREKIIDTLQRAEGMVVVDECNYEYLGETVVDLIGKYENLIISRSFSKNFGLAGLRLGFAISNPQNIKKLAIFCQYFRVNRMAEKAAEKVLKYLDYYQEAWEKIKKVRDKFVRQINELGFSAYDSQANFVLVEFKNKEETERVWKYLKEKGIYTLAGWENEFSGLEGQFIRFTIGEEWEMDKAVEVLSDYIKKNQEPI
ncbi:MAG: histidinol-phosphate aminotransferase family protein [Candidatus Atribacteria bacterium]|nr:MAG: histidinol-phosphate aminotransferase family protein [Candidatus Atribacteria bacterium]